jgi:type II secretory pathway pseudopilin PulG
MKKIKRIMAITISIFTMIIIAILLALGALNDLDMKRSQMLREERLREQEFEKRQKEMIQTPTIIAEIKPVPAVVEPVVVEEPKVIIDIPAVPKEPTKPQTDLYKAVKKVESKYTNGAFNPKEMAYGPVQIRQVLLDDLTRLGYNYTPQDCFDPDKSHEIMYIYTDFYIKEMGYEDTLENRARIWNGGPNGPNKKSTEDYWIKIQEVWTSIQ